MFVASPFSDLKIKIFAFLGIISELCIYKTRVALQIILFHHAHVLREKKYFL